MGKLIIFLILRMLVRKSTNLLRSALRLRGAYTHAFSTSKVALRASRFAKGFLFAAFLPLSVYIYCDNQQIQKDTIEIIETDADLKDGGFKTVQVGPKEDDLILLVKEGGEYYCLQNKCSHFGFALNKGLLVGDKLICPLHNATFDIKTGRAETGPVFDGLETYKVEVSGKKVKIHLPKNRVNTNKTPKMAKKENNANPMVIIGGGPASEAAMEAFRKAGHTGNITLITKDSLPPYDRTALSKRWNVEPDNVRTRKDSFYQQNGIDLFVDSEVKSIDYPNKTVVLSSGKTIPYEKLLISSGCDCVLPSSIPEVKGLQMLQLRSYKDFQNIKKSVEKFSDKKNIHVTIVGGGFIGWELASTIKSEYKGKVSVTVVDQSHVPHEKHFGSEVAKVLRVLAENNEIRYESSATIKSGSSGEDSAAKSLILTNNNTIESDLVILATGVKPVTNFVGDLALDPQNKGITTDAFLRTSQKDVFAAGDVASYPYWYTGEQVRFEHYNQAIYQGEIAALNMLGKKIPVDTVPFFWSRAFNQSIQFIGYAPSWDEVILKGDTDKPSFVAYYVKNNKVVAASCINSLNSIMILREAMMGGMMPTPDEVRDSAFDPKNLVEELKKLKPACSKCDLYSPTQL